jgi:ABC-type multidrug transport system ATPase subunit
MEHVVLFAKLKRVPSGSVTAEATKIIEEVRLTDSMHQQTRTFSGGMKRRLSVAMSFIGNPSVVRLKTILCVVYLSL